MGQTACSSLVALGVFLVTGAALADAPMPAGEAPSSPAIQQDRQVTPSDWRAPPRPVPYAGDIPVYILPEELPYRDGAPVPRGYHVERKVQPMYMFTGLTTFVACYASSVLLSAAMNVWDDDIAVVPIVGPYIAAATVRDRQMGNDFSLFNKMGMIFSGIGQTVGAALIFTSYVAGPKVLARDNDKIGASVRVTPAVGMHGAGVAITAEM